MNREIQDIGVATRARAGRGNASDSRHVVRGTRGARAEHMRRFAALILASLLPACFFDSNEPASDDDIVGPYTGERTRYVVDRLILPQNTTEARTFGTDLDGNDVVDNQLGSVISTLLQQNPGEQHIADRIAGGELAMAIEIQADSLAYDEKVGVWVIGPDGTAGRPIGGALVDGTFVPNFVRDTARTNTGSGVIALPVIADADAVPMDVAHMEISLVPDGAGGYDAQIHGAVRDALPASRDAIAQQLRERPEQHRWMWLLMDRDTDGTIEPSEWSSSILASLLAPDLTIAGEDLLSIGIGFHVIPCASGNCALGTPTDHCFDRVVDGDEVDVDCGGACGPCGAELTCTRGDDCQSGTCTANTCTAPTCFDGLKNGYEASTDCGGACAQKCDVGAVCGLGRDCASGRCSATTGTGVCLP